MEQGENSKRRCKKYVIYKTRTGCNYMRSLNKKQFLKLKKGRKNFFIGGLKIKLMKSSRKFYKQLRRQ